MSPLDRLDIQSLLVAKVVVNAGQVDAGRLADLSNRRGFESLFRENWPGSGK
jgi:hypothetical protein